MPEAPPPLLAVDAPSLLYRAFFALPRSITSPQGHPVNALLGTANLLLQALERFSPRATVLCWGAEAAVYRKAAFPAYHGDRPEMPEELVWQWERAGDFFGAFGFPSLHAGDLEADDLLGALAAAETQAGGRALLFTGDRDMFQCVSEHVAVLWPGAKGGPELIDEAGVRERYGIEPEQVPDFIALRGDPSDGLPGAKGIGEKTARDLLCEHGTLDALLELPMGLKPRVRGALEAQRDELLAFREIATLQPVAVQRPADRALDREGAAAAARGLGMERLAGRLA
ncbi:MAG TPA: 5'-3' exonuclease [Baekduia sp.]|nr:5'-3' exonuclease [Baekduia sp.]